MAFLRKIYYSIKKAARGGVKQAPETTDPIQRLIQGKTSYWQDPAWADRHLKNAGERPHTISIPIFARIMEYVPKGAKLLDVGCGHGRYSIPFAEQGLRVVAADVSREMLALLEKNKGGLPIETSCEDAHHLSFADSVFDVVFSNDMMGHFPDWQALLKEQARVCRPGGRVIFSLAFREHRSFAEQLPGAMSFQHDYSPDPGSKLPYWTETSHEEIVAAGNASGMTLKALHPLKFFHDSYLMGALLGTEDNKAMKIEFATFLRGDQKVQDFYTWLELRVLQKLPFFASNLTLVVFEKNTRA